MLYQINSKIIKSLLYSLLALPLLINAQTLAGDSAIMFKRTSWLSDNARISPFDLFVDSLLEAYMQTPENCGISIGISENGKDHFYNYGEVQRDSKVVPDQHTIYEIGSLTSTFSGLLLAQAIVEKKIKAEDDIGKYLEGDYSQLMYKEIPILVKHLANHSSGLGSVPVDLQLQEGYDPLNPYAIYTKEKLLNYLKTQKPANLPGTTCEYSNIGIALLGIIIENAYHKSFEELVKEKISAPLGLANTAINLTWNQLSKTAKGNNAEGKSTPAWSLGAFQSAGGLKSSTEDMLRYLLYNLDEKDEAVKLSHRATFTSRQTVGLSWFIKKTKQGNTLFWHDGATFGFSGFNGFIKEKKCSVIILANSARNIDYIGIAILNYLQK